MAIESTDLMRLLLLAAVEMRWSVGTPREICITMRMKQTSDQVWRQCKCIKRPGSGIEPREGPVNWHMPRCCADTWQLCNPRRRNKYYEKAGQTRRGIA